MEILQYILLALSFLFSLIFISNACALFLMSNSKEREGFANKNLLILGAFCTVFLMCGTILLKVQLDRKTEEIKKPIQYELIQEPLYRVKK